MLFEKYLKINKCYESHMMFTHRKKSNSSPQQPMQGFLTRSFSLNTCPVTLSAAELLLLFDCLGEGNRIFLPTQAVLRIHSLNHIFHAWRKKYQILSYQFSEFTLHMHTMLLFAVCMKVFFILWKSFPFMTQSTTTAIYCKILHRVSLFA